MDMPHFPSEEKLHNLLKLPPQEFFSIESIGFSPATLRVPVYQLDKGTLLAYDSQRDIPSAEGTSRLGVYLRFGVVSVRKVVEEARKYSPTLLRQLIWREFFMAILYHFPHVKDGAFKKAYNYIEWENNPVDFYKWCAGETGYPLVDAGMRQLNATGYMHNRARMVAASFLTKHLLVDWRWGEAYFAEKLLDFELASNNGGWQWAAGTGCDAAPYFRIFNPESQQKKFDSNFDYIKKWVPEFSTAKYAGRIIDHAFARERALAAYKKALKQGF